MPVWEVIKAVVGLEKVPDNPDAWPSPFAALVRPWMDPPRLVELVEKLNHLGAQGQLWTEYMPDADHVEYMAFPRACALAEIVWPPPAKKAKAKARASSGDAALADKEREQLMAAMEKEVEGLIAEERANFAEERKKLEKAA